MKDWLIKSILLMIILVCMLWASSYEKKRQAINHEKYLMCVEKKMLNKYGCSVWAQFDTDGK